MNRSQETVRVEAPEGRLVLGRYRLQRRLGAGGFGVVWLGRDEHLQRDVAVKVMARDEEAESGRASREARAAARLNHPGIVALYELAEDEHDAYLVSELVPGRDDGRAGLREGAVGPRRGPHRLGAVRRPRARARAGVIHRDVKPGNVMVIDEPAAGAGFAKLADFGVAHMATGDPLTRTGDVVGTLAYMAPEQAEGARATPACDVYSLALTLYEAWTGENPVRGGGALATARRLGRPLPSLDHRRPDLPAVLCDVIDDALDPDPEVRPDPTEFAADLAEAEPQLSDVGGLVEEETRERVGLTEATRRLIPFTRPREVEPPPWQPHPEEQWAQQQWPSSSGPLRPTPSPTSSRGATSPPASPPGRAPACSRACSCWPRWATWGRPRPSRRWPPPPWSPSAWRCCRASGGWPPRWPCCGWLVSPEADREGTALLLAFVLAPVPLLLPRAGLLWSVPILAPLLGAASLAPAFVAVAALAPTMARRAGLAAAGFLWLAGGEALTGDPLLFGSPDGTESLALWQSSITAGASDAVWPLLSSPALAPALVWAGFAVLLPFLVRGRSTGVDLAAGSLWAIGLLLAHSALGDLLASSGGLADARGAVAGTLIGAVAAVAAAAALARRDEPVHPPAMAR